MKLRRLLALPLALLLALMCGLPAYAGGDEWSSAPEQEETASVCPEDETLEPDESLEPDPVSDEVPDTGVVPLPDDSQTQDGHPTEDTEPDSGEPPASDAEPVPGEPPVSDAEPIPGEPLPPDQTDGTAGDGELPPPDDAAPPAGGPETDEVTEPPEEQDETRQDEGGETFFPLQEDPAIVQVVVPDSGRVIINPYQLAVDVDGERTTEQIVSGVYSMINLSSVPVAVSASAVGTVFGTGDMVFVTTPPAEETYRKELFLYVEFQNEFYGDGWFGQYTGAPNQLLVTEQPSGEQDVLTLEAGGAGLYRVFGSVTKFPEYPWSVGDDFRVVLTFTFAPLIPGQSGLAETNPEPYPWETPENTQIPEIPEASSEAPEISGENVEMATPEEAADPESGGEGSLF